MLAIMSLFQVNIFLGLPLVGHLFVDLLLDQSGPYEASVAVELAHVLGLVVLGEAEQSQKDVGVDPSIEE